VAAQGVTSYLRALGDRTGRTVNIDGASVPDLLSKEPKAVFQAHNCPRAPSRRSGQAVERQVGNQKCRGCSHLS